MLFRSTALFALACVASARRCSDLLIDVSLESRNAVFDLESPTEPEDVTNFYLGLSRSGNNLTEQLHKGVSRPYHRLMSLRDIKWYNQY